MIPYKDDNPLSSTPYVTIAIIALNVVIFIFELVNPEGIKELVVNYGAIPYSLMTFQSFQPVSPVVTIFTSMFMHGGFLHIAGNMLYFWIFGNNIEDQLGHFKFIIFYLLCGIVAVYAYSMSDPTSLTPMIGASGAIAGILGAYILLFPRAQVYTIVFLGIFVQVIRLPALIVIGFWAIIQLANGLLTRPMEQGGGIAWFAHVGGFVFGLLLIKLMLPKRRRRGRGWS